jgi:hypothetical protein
MLTLFLNREPEPHLTRGVLLMPSGRELHVLERPWRDNRPFDSCIPDGVYLITPYKSPRFGDVYIVIGGTVSQFKSAQHERYGILFHGANKVQQLAGCLAPGLSWSGDFLQHSQSALKLMMNELNGETAMLFISGLEQHQ